MNNIYLPLRDAGTDSPQHIVLSGTDCKCASAPTASVGQASHNSSDAELEAHIADCTRLWQQSYERFQQHGNPHDRDDALLWLHRQNEAILMRSSAVQAARHAAFERRLDEGADFFQGQGDRDRLILAARGGRCD